MSKTSALYVIIIAIVGAVIFLGVAASNKSAHNTHAQLVQQAGGCCQDGAQGHAGSKEAWNEVCPVMGGKVNSSSATVEHNEKHYGFCCPGCIDTFAGDPETYAANLSEDGKKFKK
jgi:YHS domain-containing protein